MLIDNDLRCVRGVRSRLANLKSCHAPTEEGQGKQTEAVSDDESFDSEQETGYVPPAGVINDPNRGVLSVDPDAAAEGADQPATAGAGLRGDDDAGSDDGDSQPTPPGAE